MPVYQFICEKHGGFEKITIKAEWDDISLDTRIKFKNSRLYGCFFAPNSGKMDTWLCDG